MTQRKYRSYMAKKRLIVMIIEDQVYNRGHRSNKLVNKFAFTGLYRRIIYDIMATKSELGIRIAMITPESLIYGRLHSPITTGNVTFSEAAEKFSRPGTRKPTQVGPSPKRSIIKRQATTTSSLSHRPTLHKKVSISQQPSIRTIRKPSRDFSNIEVSKPESYYIQRDILIARAEMWKYYLCFTLNVPIKDHTLLAMFKSGYKISK